MKKDKKAKRKRREEEEIGPDEASGDDGPEGSNHSPSRPWNTDDLYFDRNGRLVVRNPALANAIARAVSDHGGIVVHMSHPSDGDRVIRAPPKNPLPPVPPWPNEGCPDTLCGRDVNLIVHHRPLHDPPRDRSWEQVRGPF